MADPDSQTTEVARVPCHYPHICGEDWCICDMTPEDIAIIDQNETELEKLKRG